jgi:hypothetical protein
LIQLLEFLGTVLALVAYFGLIAATVLLFFAYRKRELLLSLVGLAIAESGRLFRVFGPAYSIEPGESTLRLTAESSLAVFLGKTLIMPMGLTIAMLGFLYFAWGIYKSSRDRSI